MGASGAREQLDVPGQYDRSDELVALDWSGGTEDKWQSAAYLSGSPLQY